MGWAKSLWFHIEVFDLNLAQFNLDRLADDTGYIRQDHLLMIEIFG